MFSWLGVLEFSFAADEQLSTSLEVQERPRHFQEAKGQGGNVARIWCTWNMCCCERAQSVALVYMSQGIRIHVLDYGRQVPSSQDAHL